MGGQMWGNRPMGTSPGWPHQLTTCLLLSPPRPQMTGRKGRVVSRPDVTVAFESRAEQGLSIDHVNPRGRRNVS